MFDKVSRKSGCIYISQVTSLPLLSPLFSIPRACAGLPPLNHMLLEHKVPSLMQATPLTTPTVPVKKPIMSAIPGYSNGYFNGHMTSANGVMNGSANEVAH